MTEYEYILVERSGPIVEVLFNRPEARNALNFPLEAEFEHALDEAEDDPEVRVVTVRGEGPVFSAGHDLKEVAQGYATDGTPSGAPRHKPPSMPRPWFFRKPLIAGVHGFVGPAANHLLGSFDFVIAGEDTKFSFEQTRMGGGSAGGITEPFQIPMRALLKLYMMGGWFNSETALRWDYVQRVVPNDQVESETRRWAEQLALITPEQIASAKEGIHRIYELRGIANGAAVGNKFSGHGSTRDRSFFTMVQEKGLKEALRFRDSQFDQDVARI